MPNPTPTPETPRIDLGELIDLLETREQDQRVWFDFGDFVPCGVSSYRGYYEDLAIEFGKEPITVQAFREMLRGAIGQTFHGYKGGDFVMDRHSRIWVSNWGHNSGTAIVGINPSCTWSTILDTRWERG